jgi:hypothetical protein
VTGDDDTGLVGQDHGLHPVAQVFIATGLRSSWAQAWPAFRNYS